MQTQIQTTTPDGLSTVRNTTKGITDGNNLKSTCVTLLVELGKDSRGRETAAVGLGLTHPPFNPGRT